MTLKPYVLAVICGLFTSCAPPTGEYSISLIKPDNYGELRRGYVDSRYGQIHYRAVHPKSNEDGTPPLIALHLSPNSGQVFSKFAPLIGKDRIVIAPDYPGYGNSDPIAGEQKISDYALAMIDVIEASGLETPVDLLGYHTGAGVALEIAQQRPELVRRLMLVAVPVLTAEERANGAALPRIPFDEEGEFAKKEFQSSWKWRGPGQSRDSVLATYSAKMMPGSRERGAQAILGYDVETALKNSTHPMMIVRVKDDLWMPSLKAKALRPDADYLELPDFGHGLFHVAPEKMTQITKDFLDKP